MPTEIKVDVTKAIADLKQYQFTPKQYNFTCAFALTKTGQMIKKDLTEIIPRNFDNPTRYTRNAIYNRWTTPDKTGIVIGIKNYADKGTPAAKYLSAEVFGGQRGNKGSELLLKEKGIMQQNESWAPGLGVRLNQYGNVSQGTIQQILSALEAQRDNYQNSTYRSRVRNASTDKIFYAQMGNVKGVFKKGPRGSLAMLMRINPYMPKYKTKFPFHTIATKSANRHYYKAFREALQYTLANLKPR